MSHQTLTAYGLWPLVIINSAVFIIFAYSFTKPKSPRDWRSFGGFSAFIVALFTEMYGVPVTIYLLAGWLQRRYPALDPLSHDAGHLWWTLAGQHGNPHLGTLHLLSYLLILGGFVLLSAAWRVLHTGTAPASARNDRRICSDPAPSVRRIHRHHVRLSASVADNPHSDHVPAAGLDVCSTWAGRRKRSAA